MTADAADSTSSLPAESVENVTEKNDNVIANSNESQSEAKTKSARARWPALESNPETFTAFLKKLVSPAETAIAVHDVFGFEPDLLMMIPQPVYAMIFLYPPSSLRKKRTRDDMESEKKDLNDSSDNEDDTNGETEPKGDGKSSSKLYYLRQTRSLGNACGTIACIHALANLRSSIPYSDDSIIGQFIKDSKSLSVSERGKFMETFEPMRREQVKSASSGGNQTQMTEGKVDYHFVCFLEDPDDGVVVEFDGCKWELGEPVRHESYGTAASSGLGFGERCGLIIQQEFMAKMPDEMNFVTLAIAPEG